MKKILAILFCCCLHAYGQQNLSDIRILMDDPYVVYPDRPVMMLGSAETEWVFSEVGKNDWKTATVPGCVHTDIATPEELYYGDNEKKYRWIEEKDWEYRTSFRLSDEWRQKKYDRFRLVFEQLDTHAEVYINDIPVLKAYNAFMSWEINADIYLKTDTSLNTIRIVFKSPVTEGQKQAQEKPLILKSEERVFTRKAQFEYGWDFGPRFVTSGIRKPVYLKAYNSRSVEITGIRIFEKNYDTAKALLDAELSIFSGSAQTVYACYNTDEGPQSVKVSLIKGDNTVFLPITVNAPKKWWPRGYGDQPVYHFSFDLRNRPAQNKKSTALSARSALHVFTDVRLVQQPDTYGKSFRFEVNGRPVFAKGVNIIPYDVFTESWNDTQLRQIYELNANMVRVWGGGYYPSHEFYLYCLVNGIMVWQDFMYACAMYPGKGPFEIWALHEVEEQAGRLQQYKNIALWCGNNEIDEGWHNWGWQKQYNYSSADSASIKQMYDYIFKQGIPEHLDAELIGPFNYVHSSPRHGWGRDSSLIEGDCHYWGVWWGKQPVDTFNYRIPRFMSEYGMQSMPSPHYLIKHASLKNSAMDREALGNHQKHPSGFGTLDFYLEKYYRIPENIFHYAYASQLLQAYTYRVAIEAHRRHRDRCMGSLLWQMNDCWPGISWSLVDHGLHTKIAYEQVKKAYETFLVSAEEQEEVIQVYVVSDSLADVQDTLSFTLYDHLGKKLRQWTRAITIQNSSAAVQLSIPKQELAAYFPSSIYAVSRLHGKNRLFHHDFVQPNRKLLADPQLRAEIVTIDRECDDQCMYEFRLTADSYCPGLACFPTEEDHPLIYRPFIAPGYPLVIRFTDRDYAYYRDLAVKPAEKFMYLQKLMGR